MLKGEHTYIVRTLLVRTYVNIMYVLSYGADPISPRHFNVRGDKMKRINRVESRQPCLIPSIQDPHQSSLVQHPSFHTLCKTQMVGII